jgi:hypothetical protein
VTEGGSTSVVTGGNGWDGSRLAGFKLDNIKASFRYCPFTTINASSYVYYERRMLVMAIMSMLSSYPSAFPLFLFRELFTDFLDFHFKDPMVCLDFFLVCFFKDA